MSLYNTSLNLRTQLTDTTSTGVLVERRLNGVIITSYPASAALSLNGQLTGAFAVVNSDGSVQYDNGGSNMAHPADGVTKVMGSFTFTGWDGQYETNTVTQNVELTGAVATAAPSAFTSGGWTLTDVPSVNGDTLEINILTLPSDNGAAITALKYRVNGGLTQVLSGTGTGARNITVTTATPSTVELWATNSTGDGAYDSKTQTPTVLTPEPIANTTVANSAALATLLSQLNSSYDTTAVANGGTAGQPFYIDCASGAYTNTLSGFNFAHMVHIRAANKAGGCTRSNTTIANSHNLRLAYFAITGDGVNHAFLVNTGSSNITLSHLRILAHPTPGSKSPSTKYGLAIGPVTSTTDRQTNITVEYCDVQRSGSDLIFCRQTDNITLLANIVNEGGADDYKLKDLNGGLIKNNWGSSKNHSPTGSHMDFMQRDYDQTTNLGVRNVDFWGNCCGDWETQSTSTGPSRQGMFSSGYAMSGGSVKQNVLVTANTHGVTTTGSENVEYNLAIMMQDCTNPGGTNYSRVYGGSGTRVNNIERTTVSNNSGADPSTLRILTFDNAGYGALFGGLRNGTETWKICGFGGDFSELMPIVGSQAHWDHASPKGPYIRLKDIFVNGIHPGNDGWPTSQTWTNGHNRFGRITS